MSGTIVSILLTIFVFGYSMFLLRRVTTAPICRDPNCPCTGYCNAVGTNSSNPVKSEQNKED